MDGHVSGFYKKYGQDIAGTNTYLLAKKYSAADTGHTDHVFMFPLPPSSPSYDIQSRTEYVKISPRACSSSSSSSQLYASNCSFELSYHVYSCTRYLSMCVRSLSARRHPAHSVSVLILGPARDASSDVPQPSYHITTQPHHHHPTNQTQFFCRTVKPEPIDIISYRAFLQAKCPQARCTSLVMSREWYR